LSNEGGIKHRSHDCDHTVAVKTAL